MSNPMFPYLIPDSIERGRDACGQSECLALDGRQEPLAALIGSHKESGAADHASVAISSDRSGSSGNSRK